MTVIEDIEAAVVDLGGMSYRAPFPGPDLLIMLPHDGAQAIPPITVWWVCGDMTEAALAFASHVITTGHLFTHGDRAHFVRWLEAQGYPAVGRIDAAPVNLSGPVKWLHTKATGGITLQSSQVKPNYWERIRHRLVWPRFGSRIERFLGWRLMFIRK